MSPLSDRYKLLDDCVCGGCGMFRKYYLRGVRGECMCCIRRTPLAKDETEAMTAWNIMQRKEKGIIK